MPGMPGKLFKVERAHPPVRTCFLLLVHQRYTHLHAAVSFSHFLSSILSPQTHRKSQNHHFSPKLTCHSRIHHELQLPLPLPMLPHARAHLPRRRPPSPNLHLAIPPPSARKDDPAPALLLRVRRFPRARRRGRHGGPLLQLRASHVHAVRGHGARGRVSRGCGRAGAACLSGDEGLEVLSGLREGGGEGRGVSAYDL